MYTMLQSISYNNSLNNIFYYTLMYVVDVRERELIRLLKEPNVKALPIADIWIGVSGDDYQPQAGGLLIERKTVRDLEASILDGRYREQRQRLIAHCQATATQPLYILEGSYFTSTGRISPQSLMKTVARLQYKHRIAVLHTQSTAETSQLVEALAAYFKEDPTNFQPDAATTQLKATDGIHVQKKVNAANPRHFAVASLAQCPGVSVKMAEAILEKYKSWSALMEAEQAELQAIIQPNGRKVGPAVAGRIYELLHAEW